MGADVGIVRRPLSTGSIHGGARFGQSSRARAWDKALRKWLRIRRTNVAMVLIKVLPNTFSLKSIEINQFYKKSAEIGV